MAHLMFIDALGAATPLAVEQIAFHGGTNLHLSWGSPRHSEDLDFLVDRDMGQRIRAVMPRIERRMRQLARAAEPALKVDISERTRDGSGLLDFRIVLSSPEVVGQVMAKAEFWQVDREYLAGYDTVFRRPGKPGDILSRISQPLPVATMEAGCADKIVAIGSRPHLKWRDLFDLWWICGQVGIDPAAMAERARHHASAYPAKEGGDLRAGLEAFLRLDLEVLAAQADPDLKRWIPRTLWDTLNPDGVREIVAHARGFVEDILEHLPPSAAPDEDGTARAALPGDRAEGEAVNAPSCP